MKARALLTAGLGLLGVAQAVTLQASLQRGSGLLGAPQTFLVSLPCLHRAPARLTLQPPQSCLRIGPATSPQACLAFPPPPESRAQVVPCAETLSERYMV